ncbi:MAG: methyltransferase domain-containing protein [Actinobacteria bacterium]|nr:methyltransferase domain-containing protein [Actinomycetota bacterium]
MTSSNDHGAVRRGSVGPGRRDRARSFGAVAERYDRSRPDYPPALVDDLVAAGPQRALDIGCGTGKVARLLRERNVTVLGLEADSRMADVARRQGIDVEVSSFESWSARGRRFDLLTCGQAWHWIDPTAGLAKAEEVLDTGGLFAPFWNFVEFDERTGRMFDDVYHAVAPEISGDAVLRGRGPRIVAGLGARLRAVGRFVRVERREYEWEQTYSRPQWIELTGTHSDHLLLGAGRLRTLQSALAAAIDRAGGYVPARYRTLAVLAFAR